MPEYVPIITTEQPTEFSSTGITSFNKRVGQAVEGGMTLEEATDKGNQDLIELGSLVAQGVLERDDQGNVAKPGVLQNNLNADGRFNNNLILGDVSQDSMTSKINTVANSSLTGNLLDVSDGGNINIQEGAVVNYSDIGSGAVIRNAQVSGVNVGKDVSIDYASESDPTIVRGGSIGNDATISGHNRLYDANIAPGARVENRIDAKPPR
jgi:hypothetical protein